MSVQSQDIYTSSNGDRWSLIRDAGSGRVFVRHQPNLRSGGRVTDTEVDEFLSVASSGPEYAMLRRLLDGPEEAPQVPFAERPWE